MARSKLAAGAIAEMLFGVGTRPALAPQEPAEAQPADDAQQHGATAQQAGGAGAQPGPKAKAAGPMPMGARIAEPAPRRDAK